MGTSLRLALFGGNFDPPHLGHLLTVTALLNSGVVDQVWLVPAGDDRYDRKPVASGLHRRSMLELMIQENFGATEKVRIETSQIDGMLPGSYTVELLAALQKAYPDYEFCLVIGSDNVSSVRGWKDGDRLVREAKWIVMPRLGEPHPTCLPPHAVLMDMAQSAQSNASSSLVRTLCAAGRWTAGLVGGHSVREYIERNKLYRAK